MSDDEDHIIGGAAIPLPPELLQAMRASHSRDHLRAEPEEARANRFLDGLDVDGLLALRWMFQCNPDSAFANSMRMDGVVETLLRVVHHVDPRTGEDPLAAVREEREGETGPRRDDDPVHEQ